MASLMRLWLVLAALLAGSLLVACGGGGDGDKDGAADEPTATAAADDEDGNGDADEPTAADDGDDGDIEAGDDAFEDVPLPRGADETSSITMSGSELPFFVPGDADVDLETYGDVTMKTFEVPGAPDDVINFFKDRRERWEEAYGMVADDGGLLIWIRDDGARFAWITTGEGSEPGTTMLTIAVGRAEE